MSYSIAIYCPDHHITYNINTLDQQGVGGGVTVRTRMAHALADEGNQVTLYVNCPSDERIRGVDYVHYSKLESGKFDIFIASTSGGGLDLGELRQKPIEAKIKVLFVHGTPKPQGFEDLAFDYVYVPSNFIRKRVENDWPIDGKKLMVSHHGIAETMFDHLDEPRDIYKLIYASHPSKGLDAAVEVFRILRQSDERFTLDILGGYQLWGQDGQIENLDSGCTFRGMVGQRELALHMKRAGFSLNLQEREEPFGLALVESLRAGCVVIASPVGAYPELIANGFNGFLVPGSHSDRSTLEETAALIRNLIHNPGYLEYIQRNAMVSSLNIHTVAKTWQTHWNWALERSRSVQQSNGWLGGRCSDCGGKLLPLPDGLHCVECGNYQKTFEVTASRIGGIR